MNRKVLAQFTHKASNFLEIDNQNYKQWVFRYTFLELEKDLGTKGDITTKSLFLDKIQRATAMIVAKESGIIAGLDEINYFLCRSDNTFRSNFFGRFDLKICFKDGDRLKKGDTIVEITGSIYDLMAVERVVLNLLMRMSGVATFTSKVVQKVKGTGVQIVPTRKTLWGLLDKRAVVLGGGGTHRINLADAVLIKDNHLDLLNRDFSLVLERLTFFNPSSRFVEIEVESVDELVSACKSFHKHKLNSVVVFLLDNMFAKDVKSAIDEVKKLRLYDDFLFEASGGICLGNVEEYAKTGVDLISMGCLTGGVKSLDLSMKIK